MLIDDYFAPRRSTSRSAITIEILNHKFRVAGIVEQGRGARKFLQIETLQDLIGAQGKASMFYLKLDDPAMPTRWCDEIKQVPGMENYVGAVRWRTTCR